MSASAIGEEREEWLALEWRTMFVGMARAMRAPSCRPRMGQIARSFSMALPSSIGTRVSNRADT